MTEATATKARTRIELPTRLSNGEVIADLPLAALVEKKELWEKAIAERHLLELELKSINAAIRAKAK